MIPRMSAAWIALLSLAVASASAGHGGQSRSGAIVFERDGDLYAIAADGSRTVRLTNTPVWDELDPAVSPNGRMIAYTRRRSGDELATLWTMRLDGTKRRRLTSRDDFDPAWSPDGKTIYFSRVLVQQDKGPDFDFHEYCGSLFRIRADRSDLRRVTNPPWEDSFHSHGEPAVSPDGTRIAYTDANQCSGGTTSYRLRVVDTYGRTTSDLVRLEGNIYCCAASACEYSSPTWSPDGRQLAFAGCWHIYVADRDGSDRRAVTPRLDAAELAWSPDGQWIAFTRHSERSEHDLWLVRPDGTGLRRLTTSEQDDHSPSWLPRLPPG